MILTSKQTADEPLLCSRPFTYRYYWLPMASAWTVIGTIVGGVLMSQVVAVAMALMKNVLDFTKIFHYFRLFSESRSTFASRQGPAYSLDMRHTLGHVLLR